MSRRDEIRMSAEEVEEFLHGRHTMSVATIGPDGYPHVVAMWYGFTADGAPAFWTYGRSQKIANLERDARMTCLVEDGESYDKLRGVELVGRAVFQRDPAEVLVVGASVAERYTGPVTDATRPFLEKQASKRVAVALQVERTVSWDHTKLGGGY